jgi:methylmalonyl-CoA mutase N-terminal domain/subunit
MSRTIRHKDRDYYWKRHAGTSRDAKQRQQPFANLAQAAKEALEYGLGQAAGAHRKPCTDVPDDRRQ